MSWRRGRKVHQTCITVTQDHMKPCIFPFPSLSGNSPISVCGCQRETEIERDREGQRHTYLVLCILQNIFPSLTLPASVFWSKMGIAIVDIS